jgi:large subunit ribosomal protein L18
MDKNKAKQEKLSRRHGRVRAKISGTTLRPRLNVFRSNTGMYIQLIDDVAKKTLVAVSNIEIKDKKTKTENATAMGLLIAEKAKKANITAIVFDRGGYKYHGRVKAVAEGARQGGLEF